MAGGLLQLLLYGPEDIYLTAEPQITFFKIVYRRHTNFSQEVIEQLLDERLDFGKKSRQIIQKLGDLVGKMYLKIELDNVIPNQSSKFAWTKRLGHAIIKSISVEIGGKILDKHYGEWLDIWYELFRNGNHSKGYLKLIGDIEVLTEFNDKIKPKYSLYIPFQFWFNRYIGLAFPIIALQYHTLNINIELNEKHKLIIYDEKFNNFDSIKITNVSLLIEYIYLDDQERKTFGKKSHEYLIEHVQTNEKNILNEHQKFVLNFDHPSKELIWIIKNSNYSSSKKFLCYSNKENYDEEILDCSKLLIKNSLLILTEIETIQCKLYNNENWEYFPPKTYGKTKNNKILIKNKSFDKYLLINMNSLKYKDYTHIQNICADLILNDDNNNNYKLEISILKTSLDKKILSIPVELMEDNRTCKNDITVNLPTNFGQLISGEENPMESGRIEFNNMERVQKKNGNFFNYLQPEMHHSNTPKDGINLYSFSLQPELYQPTGTTNLGRTESNKLEIWIKDSHKDLQLYVFSLSYNILRILSGLSGLVY
ncbi:Large eukaryotic DNA virus major capsid protein [uncultured virus]|nr:Large eukaryotic DNA virus major capsid protein [uncultured virus]